MNKNDAREIAQAQRLRDEIEPLHAALHNVLIVGDAHGAVLELLQALDRDRELNSLGWKDNFKNYDDWLRARRANTKRLERARARFVISSTPTPANDDAHEVGA